MFLLSHFHLTQPLKAQSIVMIRIFFINCGFGFLISATLEEASHCYRTCINTKVHWFILCSLKLHSEKCLVINPLDILFVPDGV